MTDVANRATDRYATRGDLVLVLNCGSSSIKFALFDAGQADILVVPDLESGNMLAKPLIYLGDAASAGIVLGAKVPVILTSRADSRQSRIASCAIALMLAHRYRAAPP